MAKLAGGKKSNQNQRYKRTSIGNSNNSRPRHKDAFGSKRSKTYRGQGKP